MSELEMIKKASAGPRAGAAKATGPPLVSLPTILEKLKEEDTGGGGVIGSAAYNSRLG